MTAPGPVLVTGGAGYVGSHAVLAFREAGYPVVVLDDLSTGVRAALPPRTAFVEGDAGDRATAAGVLGRYGIETVAHLAGSSSVPAPLHPYGRSKLAAEWMLADVAARSGMGFAALRYFNVAGADPRVRAGQPRGAAHLFKAACEAAVGTRGGVTVFGTDHDTPDGTCVRDYLHAADLADLHVAVLRALEDGHPGGAFNCGSGRGVSVREAVAAVRRAAGTAFPVRDGPRRPGDPPVLVADPARLGREFGWSPRHDLDAIARTALAWERALRARGGGADRSAGRVMRGDERG